MANENLPAATEKNIIVNTLYNKRADLLQLLPRHMRTEAGVDRLLRVTTAAILANADLKKCTPESLITGVVQAAQLGLEPTGQYGGAYLVPFRNKVKNKATGVETWITEATMIPDYRGLIEIVRRSGQLKTIDADVVYENDEFDFERGTRPFLRHRRAWNKDRGVIVGVWAAAVLKDGGEQFTVMDVNEVDQIKALSKGAKSNFSPWNTEVGYPEMMKKTAIRRLCKLLPRSIEIQDAFKVIDEADPIEIHRTPQPARSGLTALTGVKAELPPASEDTAAGSPEKFGPAPGANALHVEDIPSDEENARRIEAGEALACKWESEGVTRAARIVKLRNAASTLKIENLAIPEGDGGMPVLDEIPSAVLARCLGGEE